MNATPSHRRRLLGAWAIAAMLATLVACGVPTPPTVEAPEITAFSATPTEIVAGESATLAWTVAGTATLALSDGTDPVDIPSGASQVAVSPDETTTYTLTATNAGGSDTAEVTVTVTRPLPEIDSFTATPSSIPEGGSSTLAWSVDGATSVALSDGTDPVAFDPGDTSVVVSPTVTTTYTLTATNAFGDATLDATVTVVPAGATSLSDLSAAVVPGSQVELDWNVLNATAVDVLTVANGDPNDELLVVSLPGTATGETVDIPVSARQVLRVCARATDPADDVCLDATFANVVVAAGDYDPYDTAYWRSETPVVPEPTVPGTLRAVMEAAAPGSVIGFAADVTTVDLYGVAFYFLSGAGNVDAHLVFDKGLTISGPASGVVLEGRSGYDVGTDPDDGAGGFTYRSRMVYVAPDVDVVLENLTLTGGDFIYLGGGIRNDGNLTARNVDVVGNRAWYEGGGIYNRGNVTFEDGLIDGNTAATLAEEVGTTYDIRGDENARICIYPSGYGGGIWNDPGGVVTLIDTTVSNNVTMISGGGIYNAAGGTVSMTGGTISGNVGNPAPFVDDPDFTDPPYFVASPDCAPDPGPFTPYSIGGGVYNGGVFSLADGDILDNDVNAAGGGLFIDRNLQMTTLTNVLVQGNEAGVDNPPGFGGGIQHEYYADEGAASNYTATNVTFGTGNTPSNLTENPIPGPAPLVISPAGAGEALPGRYVPAPGARER